MCYRARRPKPVPLFDIYFSFCGNSVQHDSRPNRIRPMTIRVFGTKKVPCALASTQISWPTIRTNAWSNCNENGKWMSYDDAALVIQHFHASLITRVQVHPLKRIALEQLTIFCAEELIWLLDGTLPLRRESTSCGPGLLLGLISWGEQMQFNCGYSCAYHTKQTWNGKPLYQLIRTNKR